MAQRKVTLALTALYVLVLQAWAQLEVNMEDRVEVLLDDVAEIPCMFDTSQAADPLVLRWFARSLSNNNRVQIYHKDQNVEAVDLGTDFSGRINVTHAVDGKMGNSILTISNVVLKDEQDFVCQVFGHRGPREGHTRLLVFKTPSFPYIEPRSYASVLTPQREEIAFCEVNDAYPAPNITWYKNRSLLQPSVDNMELRNKLTSNPSGLITAQSTLFLKVAIEDRDAEFYCEVNFFTPGGINMMESERIDIEIHYPSAKVHIKQVSPSQLVKEGDTVEISCHGDGNPQPIMTFQYKDLILTSEYGQLVLKNVTRAKSGLYYCLSLDPLSFVEIQDSLQLTVHYLDDVVITTEDSSHVLEQGQNLTLTCNAHSSLHTHTVWYRDGTVLQEGHFLHLVDVSYDMAGTYVCEVYATNLTELRKQNSVDISVRGEPVIVEGVTMVTLYDEEMVNLSCSAIGYPTPTIQWSLPNNQTVLHEVITESDYAVLSVITIRAVGSINASCLVTSELGSAQGFRNVRVVEVKKPTPTTSTNLAPVKKEGSGVIIAVIIILILLLAILGSVLYFLYKKGKIPCGRSGKQDLMKEKSSNDDVVVEMKNSRSEEAVLLQGVNGEKKFPQDQ